MKKVGLAILMIFLIPLIIIGVEALDHINGNNKDNRLENLRWVCPNCDRQLETFGSKNKRTWASVESGETSGL